MPTTPGFVTLPQSYEQTWDYAYHLPTNSRRGAIRPGWQEHVSQ